MRKKELVKDIAVKKGIPQKDIQEIVELFMDGIKNSLREGDKVTLMGFGTFEVKHRKEKRGTNPSTKDELIIEAKNVPKFRPCKEFKDLVK